MKPVVYEIKEGNEALTSNAGLAIAGSILNQTRLSSRLDSIVLDACKNPIISNSDVVSAMFGLICLGKPDYDAIEPFRSDPFFSQALNINQCPSSPALRQRIDVVGNAFDGVIKEESSRIIRLLAPQITPVQTSAGLYVPLDIDVSPHDNSRTKKEGVSRTYKGMDGYSPIYAYLASEGYLVNLELREGSQHCQKNTPEFLEDSIHYARNITDEKILLRLDSGNDSVDNIVCCEKHNIDYIIKRNQRKEIPEAWLNLAKSSGVEVPCREGKRMWRGITCVDPVGKPLSRPIVFQVVERTSKKGQALVFPEIEVDTWYSSLNVEPFETIRLYRDHGTSEQFHSEIKGDLDLERLPSGRFASNAVVLQIGMLAYNILRICGQESLRMDNGNAALIPDHRRPVERRRLRTVIFDLMYVAGRIIHTGRKWIISLGRCNSWASLWGTLYRRFALHPL